MAGSGVLLRTFCAQARVGPGTPAPANSRPPCLHHTCPASTGTLSNPAISLSPPDQLLPNHAQTTQRRSPVKIAGAAIHGARFSPSASRTMPRSVAEGQSLYSRIDPRNNAWLTRFSGLLSSLYAHTSRFKHTWIPTSGRIRAFCVRPFAFCARDARLTCTPDNKLQWLAPPILGRRPGVALRVHRARYRRTGHDHRDVCTRTHSPARIRSSSTLVIRSRQRLNIIPSGHLHMHLRYKVHVSALRPRVSSDYNLSLKKRNLPGPFSTNICPGLERNRVCSVQASHTSI